MFSTDLTLGSIPGLVAPKARTLWSRLPCHISTSSSSATYQLKAHSPLDNFFSICRTQHSIIWIVVTGRRPTLSSKSSQSLVKSRMQLLSIKFIYVIHIIYAKCGVLFNIIWMHVSTDLNLGSSPGLFASKARTLWSLLPRNRSTIWNFATCSSSNRSQSFV